MNSASLLGWTICSCLPSWIVFETPMIIYFPPCQRNFPLFVFFGSNCFWIEVKVLAHHWLVLWSLKCKLPYKPLCSSILILSFLGKLNSGWTHTLYLFCLLPFSLPCTIICRMWVMQNSEVQLMAARWLYSVHTNCLSCLSFNTRTSFKKPLPSLGVFLDGVFCVQCVLCQILSGGLQLVVHTDCLSYLS